MTGFTDVFGGSTLQAAQVAYASVSLSSSITTVWPPYANGSVQVLARLMDVASSGSYSIALPDATLVTAGQDVFFSNPGANTYTINDYTGSPIATVAPGTQRYLYLTDNSTQAGTWHVIQMGVGSSSPDASQLAGYGLKAIGATLNQSAQAVTFTANQTLGASDRTKVFVNTGGAVSLTLPLTTATGSDYFVEVRNQGSGVLTIIPVGGELIDGSATIALQLNESCFIHAGSGAWYTVGRGRNQSFNFTQLLKTVTGGTTTLSLTEASNVVQTYSGTATSNVTLVLPSVVQVYYISNQVAGGFTFTVQSPTPGTTLVIPANQNAVVFCDGTNVINASTSVSGLTALTLAGGSAAAPSLGFIAANNGLYAPNSAAVAVTAAGTENVRWTSGQTQVPAGTAGAPSYGFVTSTGTGIYLSATNTLGFSTGAALRMTLDGSGNLVPNTNNSQNLGSGTNAFATVYGTTFSGSASSAATLSATLAVNKGGTGLTSYTVGDLIVATGTTTLASLADAATGNVLLSGGVGASPSYGKVNMASMVTGTLAVANGGTGVTTSTGSGNNVLSASPTLTGTITADTLTLNVTPLAITSGGTGGTTSSGTGAVILQSSPTLTGSPVAPTQATSDNSTKLATTAFVQAIFATVPGGSLPSLAGNALKQLRVNAGETGVEWAATAPSGSITTSGYTMNTGRLLGRTSVSTGAIEEISMGAGLNLSGGTLSVTASSALSAITAATGSATIANGNNPIAWNWTQSTASQSGFTISETTASTGGSGSQVLHKIGTLATSTADPLQVQTRGVDTLRISRTGDVTVTALNGTTGSGAGGSAVNITAGQGASTSGGGSISLTSGDGGVTSGTGGNLTLSSGTALGGSNGGQINISAGGVTGGAGTGGAVAITAGNNGGAGLGGIVTIQGGVSKLAQSGNSGGVVINGGNAGAVASVAGGPIVLTAGAGSTTTTGGVGGAINITSGVGGLTANDGAINITTGGHSNGTAVSGVMTLSTGANASGITGGVNINTGAGQQPGAISIQPGLGATGTAGAVNITGGQASGAVGGAVNITSGTSPSGFSGSTVTIGGNVVSAGTGTGGNVVLNGGDNNATGLGGIVTINGGKSGAAQSGNSGGVVINGGAAGAVASVAGGPIVLTAGAGSTTTTGGVGGAVTITAGAGGLAAAGGALNLNSGTGGATGTGGNINITASNGGATSGSGGAVFINGGNTTSGTAGQVSILAGLATTTGAPGSVSIAGGYSSTSNAVGGAVNITSGSGGATGGASGDVNISSNTAGAASTGNVKLTVNDAGSGFVAGIITLQGGASKAAQSGNSGGVVINGGAAGAVASVAGGPIVLTGGAGSTTTTGGTGGNISITGGLGGLATRGGNVNILGGNGGATGQGGNVQLTGGAGGGTSGAGGTATLQAGAATTSGAGGAATVAGGNGVGAAGGDVNIQAGTGTANGAVNFVNTNVANGAVATTITSLGPTGASTTIVGWLKIKVGGTTQYIPYW